MITPTPADLQVLAVAIGFLISGTFMRFVWKTPAPSRIRKRADDRRPRR